MSREYDISPERRVVVILHCPGSGCYWKAQTGGVACQQPCVEGILLPVSHARLLNKQLVALHQVIGCYGWNDSENRLRVQSVLDGLGIPLRVVDSIYNQEAWMEAVVVSNSDDVLRDFVGEEVVIVWSNCD